MPRVNISRQFSYKPVKMTTLVFEPGDNQLVTRGAAAAIVAAGAGTVVSDEAAPDAEAAEAATVTRVSAEVPAEKDAEARKGAGARKR